MFEEYFEKFTNDRGFNRNYSNRISISKDEYQKLIRIEKEYELLAEEYKKINTKNEGLLEELEDLREHNRKFEELEQEKEKYLNLLLRVQADFENYKKRSERENKQYSSYIIQKMLKKLIDHYDNLVRALNMLETIENGNSISKGFKLIIKNFEKLLKEEGVEPMKSEGKQFDPFKHEAIMLENHDDLPENTIIEELEKGYYLNGEILRPAKVK
ncbi:MAG: nucleotide exchange factor GrpE, partial [Promethearchaeota archaeon]